MDFDQEAEFRLRDIMLNTSPRKRQLDKLSRQIQCCMSWRDQDLKLAQLLKLMPQQMPEGRESPLLPQHRIELILSCLTDRSSTESLISDVSDALAAGGSGEILVDLLAADLNLIFSRCADLFAAERGVVYIVETDGMLPQASAIKLPVEGNEYKVIEFNASLLRYIEFMVDRFSLFGEIDSQSEGEAADAVWATLVNGLSEFFRPKEVWDELPAVERESNAPSERFQGARLFILAHELGHFYLNQARIDLFAKIIIARWGDYFRSTGKPMDLARNWALELHCDIFSMQCLFGVAAGNSELLREYVTGVLSLKYSLQLEEYCNPAEVAALGFAPAFDFSSHPPASIRRHWLRIIFGMLTSEDETKELRRSVDHNWNQLREAFASAPFCLPHDARREQLNQKLGEFAYVLAKRLDFPFHETCSEIFDTAWFFPEENHVLASQLVMTGMYESALMGDRGLVSEDLEGAS